MAWLIYPYTLTIVLLSAGLAHAYPTPVDFSGELSRWDIDRNSGPIVYEIIGEPMDIESVGPLVDEAASMWSEVEGSYFRYASKEDEGKDKAHVSITLEGSFGSDSYSSGYAIFDEYDKNSFPTHCDIHIALNQGGLAKTILHELGHCVGLGHSLIPESIMSYKDEKNGFYLDTDDIAAVSRLYSIHSDHAKLPPGCAVGSGVKGSSIYLVLILLFPMVIPSVARNLLHQKKSVEANDLYATNTR